MSVKKNLIFNYLSQFYIGFIGILLIPVYIKLMGAEAYGLVGFFITVQTLFVLLDFGLSSTAIKLVSSYRGGASTKRNFRYVLRSIEQLFLIFALLVTVSFIIFSNVITDHWFSFSNLNEEEVYYSVILIGILASLRWQYSFYRGIVNGYEKIFFLSWFGALMASGKYVLVILALIFIDSSPLTFFTFQIMVSLIEITIITKVAYGLLPKLAVHWDFRNFKQLHKVSRFTVQVGAIGALWVLISQYDKLMLSNWLNLTDYGIYMMLVLAASVVTYFNSGMYSVLLPRINVLQAEKRFAEIEGIYINYTKVLLLLVVPIVSMIAVFPDSLLKLWTLKSYDESVYVTLTLISLGNLFVPLLAFPYLLQYANSDFKVAISVNVSIALILPFSLPYLFNLFGTVGAGINWLLLVFLAFIASSSLVHRKYLPKIGRFWLFKVVVPLMVIPILIVLTFKQFIIKSDVLGYLEFVSIYIVVFLAALLTQKETKAFLYLHLSRLGK